MNIFGKIFGYFHFTDSGIRWLGPNLESTEIANFSTDFYYLQPSPWPILILRIYTLLYAQKIYTYLSYNRLTFISEPCTSQIFITKFLSIFRCHQSIQSLIFYTLSWYKFSNKCVGRNTFFMVANLLIFGLFTMAFKGQKWQNYQQCHKNSNS